MTPIDTAWLRMDRPNNLMMIVGILALQGPVNLDLLEQVLGERIAAIPRFRCKVEKESNGFLWVEDTHFSLENHIRRIRLPGEAGQDELQRLVSDLASEPLNWARPLWQFHIVEQYQGGAAIVMRIHHAIGDGISLVAKFLDLADPPEGVEAWRADPQSEDDDAIGHGSTVLGRTAQRALGLSEAFWKSSIEYSGILWKAYLTMLSHPGKILDLAGKGTGVTQELARLLTMSEDSRTRFKAIPSGRKRLAWSQPLALADIKAISHARHCSVNDLMLAAVTGALRRYLEDKGDPTDGVEVRAVVPVNLRPPGTKPRLGNWFGLIAVELPVGIIDPQARLDEIGRRMAALKGSYEPIVTLGVMAALGAAPKMVQDKLADFLLGRMTAVMTNVPGPKNPIHLAGARWRQAMFWVPQSGNVGMGVSILSFDGHIQFGLSCDVAVVPDPEQVVAHFESEVEAYVYLTLLEGESVPVAETPLLEDPPQAPRRPRRAPARRKAAAKG